MMSPGSCSSGLRSLPSAGMFGNNRSKGLEVSSENARKPTAMSPITLSTRAIMTSGKPRLKNATAVIHPASINTHSNKDPS